jgi:hypothetical protein
VGPVIRVVAVMVRFRCGPGRRHPVVFSGAIRRAALAIWLQVVRVWVNASFSGSVRIVTGFSTNLSTIFTTPDNRFRHLRMFNVVVADVHQVRVPGTYQ